VQLNIKYFLNYSFILTGFLSLFTAFYFKIGSFNIRICDVFFYGLIFLVIWKLAKNKTYINLKTIVLSSIFILAVLYIFFNTLKTNVNANQLYASFSTKFFINRYLWIILYILIYLTFKEQFLEKFLEGLAIACALNVVFIIFEFIVIVLFFKSANYDFLNNIGIFVEPRKYIVFNQGLIRPTGFTIDPNYAASYAGIALLHYSNKKVLSLKNWLLIASILILFSRSAIFSLIITYLITIIFNKKNNPNEFNFSNLKILIFSGLSIFALVLFLFPDFIIGITERLTVKDRSAATRFSYINLYIENTGIIDILFGKGSSSSGYFLNNFSSNSFTKKIWSPESNYITIFIEQGLIFTTIFFLIIFFILKKLANINIKYFAIFIYINLMGISYNFLGDRIYPILFISFSLYAYSYIHNLQNKIFK